MKPGSRNSQFDVGSQLPTLEGERVKIRWLEDADLPALFRIF